MIISIKHYDAKHTVEIPDGSDVDEVMANMLSMLLVSGFQHEEIMQSIEGYLQDKQWISNQG